MITQQEEVYLQLRDALFRGKFEPGKALTIRGIASMLDVSTTPVREALRRLVSEGALKLLQNRRVTVPEMTPEKLQELYFSRVQLECHAAVKAAKAITTQGIEQLIELNNAHNIAIEQHDVEGYIFLNFEFHRQLYKHANLEVITALIESLWLQMAPFMRSVADQLSSSHDSSTSADAHAQIITAIQEQHYTKLAHLIHEDILDGIRIQQQLMHWSISS